MSDAPEVSVDPSEFWNDPYPALASMRADTPICFVPELNATLITKRDAIATCEKNVAVFSSDQPGGLMNVLMGKNMMRSDGDEHRHERSIYSPPISPREIELRWHEAFASLADDVLDSFESVGEVDLVTEYATAVSGEALKVMTGLTNITYQEMDAWSQGMIDGIANYIGDPEIAARCETATSSIDAAIDERLPVITAEPDHSLLSVMVHAGMAEEKVRANIKLTISGGQNEPRDAIAGAAWALLTHPEQLAMLRAGDVSWLRAFEEYCRWVAPIGMSPRRIAAEHTYNGVTFEPEERAFLMFGSAGRDEDHFDRGDEFDITRNTRASLHFGAGPHFCAGAAASRSLVGDVALPKLFERLPDLRLAGEVPFGGWAFRGPLTMPVAWG